VHLYVCMSSLMLLNLSGLLFHVVSPLHLFRVHIGVAVSINTDASPLRIMLAHCAGCEHLNIIGHRASFGFDPIGSCSPPESLFKSLRCFGCRLGLRAFELDIFEQHGTTFLSPFPSSIMPCASCPSVPSLRVPCTRPYQMWFVLVLALRVRLRICPLFRTPLHDSLHVDRVAAVLRLLEPMFRQKFTRLRLLAGLCHICRSHTACVHRIVDIGG